MAAAAILDFDNLKNLTADTLRRASVHHHAIFRFFKMAAAAILNFQKLKFLTIDAFRRLIMCYHTKVRVDRQTVAEI